MEGVRFVKDSLGLLLGVRYDSRALKRGLFFSWGFSPYGFRELMNILGMFGNKGFLYEKFTYWGFEYTYSGFE